LFVTYDGVIKVLDFGIAKAADRVTRTQTGSIKGKFAYMSPEQCRGESLDRRSDVFSLGILLFESTTCHRLYKRPSDLLVLKAICEDALQLPTEVAPDYPPCLEGVVVKALARSRNARYESTAAMREVLLSALDTLGEDRHPQEPLRALMHDLFADRITQKQEMLNRVRAGSRIPSIVEAEADAVVELPDATFHGTLATASVPTAPGRRRRERLSVTFI